MTFSVDKAIDAGLTFRPLAETVRDTVEWAATLPGNSPKPAGLPGEKEAELLAAISA